MREMIARVVGESPPTCPWRCFEESIVADVAEAHRLIKLQVGSAALGGDDPPEYLVEGVGVFDGAINATENERRDRERQQREAERAAKQKR